MKPYRLVLILLVALLALASLRPDAAVQAQAPTPSSAAEAVGITLPPIIPSTTHILSRTTTQYTLKTPTGETSSPSTYSFSQRTSELTNVKAGDIIVSDVSDSYPNGFLRKVTAVNYNNGGVILQTSSAALDEAIQQGEVNYTQSLNLLKAQPNFQAPGVQLIRTAAVPRLNLTNVVVYDRDGNTNTKNDQILANGFVEFQPTINFSMKVQNWKLQNLTFTTTGNENAQLKLEYKFDKSFLKTEKMLAKYTLPTITVFVGIVPVVLTPMLSFNVGTDGKVSVGVSAGVAQQLSFKYGLQYNGTSWSPIANLTKSFAPIKPSLSGTLDVKGFAKADISLMIYGVAGPYLKVEVYLKLHANISEVPWWKLSAGLDVPVGVRVEVLGRKLVDYSKTVVALEVVIAKAPLPTPTPTRTHTKTRTKTFTRTPTKTPTKTASKTFTSVPLTLTTTKTAPPTLTFTPSVTLTPTINLTATETSLPLSTVTSTPTQSLVVNTATPSPTLTHIITSTPSPTSQLISSATPTITPSFTSLPVTQTVTPTISNTPSHTQTITPTVTPTPTGSQPSMLTPTPTITATPTIPAPFIVQPSLSPAYSATCGNPPSYWWKNPNGYKGLNGTDLFVTMNANNSSQSSNIATYRPNITVAGQYKIEIYVAYHPVLPWPCTGVSIAGDTSKANYKVNYASGSTTVIIDQLPLNNQWANLGTFRLNTGTSGTVVLSDITGEPFSTRFVSVNVIRITWVGP